MSVRFSNMWACLAIWLFMDLLMIAIGSDLPSWLAFDGKDALRRDLWTIIFIGWMWVGYREPSHPL